MEDMKLFRIILVLSSLLFISNCVGITSQKVDINKVKKDEGWIFENPDSDATQSANLGLYFIVQDPRGIMLVLRLKSLDSKV